MKRWLANVAASANHEAIEALRERVERVDAQYGHEYASLHEAHAVLLEEVDELWTLVRQQAIERDPEAVAREALDIAAAALRIARQWGPA